MPTFRSTYLICGDDHGRVAERRARLRSLAEKESGVGGVELFVGAASTPEAVALATSSMTFAIGRRFLIVDGVERWKDSEVESIVDALAQIDPESITVAFFAREEGRHKVPAALVAAVKAAGGQVAQENMLKSRELPRWVIERAAELGIELDHDGARALVGLVGDRQQRLMRELEKLALEHGEGARLGIEEVSQSAASSSERKVWTLADALVAGDERATLRILIELRGQGERVTGLIFTIVRRLRDASMIAEALAAGQTPAQIKKGLRMPGFAADRLIADVSKRDTDAYRRGLGLMADLELGFRGGRGGVLGEDTAAVRAVIGAAR